ncbi:hypothetical protein GCM10009623_26290 [Nocardioides aestuarii]|uniref:MXAN_6640 family putative metalloprotease n=1 Tax=Nocardioides aestuarii TaxID=252231 RepID=A0ABW4TQK9_9ACTN
MRARLAAALLAALLTVPLLGVTSASAAPRDLTGPELPGPTAVTAGDRATAALDRAQRLLTEKSSAAARRQAEKGADATLALRNLVRAYDDLSASDREAADRLLARPTDGGADPDGNGYTTTEATPRCGDVVCIHYVPTTSDAPNMTDTSPANGVPDSVEQALALAEGVNSTYTAAGYRRPDPDGSLGGSSGKVDIYLANLGDQGLYGYCTTDQGGDTYNRWAYCVIDDDFAEFPANTPLENLQVTLAHEYFHAVQFAYDTFEDGWVMEATATWAEEQLFDSVDDNRQYIQAGQVGRPYYPLDYYGDSAHYGNWVFFQYLTERWRGETGGMPTLVLDLWKRLSGRAGDPDDFSTQALQNVLAARGTSFTKTYGQFAEAMRQPAKALAEGKAAAYRPAAPADSATLSPRVRVAAGEIPVNHLTNLALRIKPSRKLGSADWRLKVQVDMPPKATAPVSRVVTHLKSGKTASTTLKFRKRGWSTTAGAFSARKVKYVELVIANASRRSNCWVSIDSPFACLGQPLDDGKVFGIRTTAFRR